MSNQQPLQLRVFHPDDHDALVQLWRHCGLVVPANDPSRDIALKRAHDPEGLIVGEASIDGRMKLVASVMVGYEGHRGWVNYLAVDPQARRRGFGRALLRFAEAWLSERGCPKLNLQVRSQNTEVLAFYRAAGYSEDDVVSLGKRFDTR